MRVLFLISGMDPKSGGPPNLLVGLANALSRRSIAVTIVSLKHQQDFSSYWSDKLDARVELLEFPRNLWSRLGYSFSLLSYLESNLYRFDVVHCHSVWELGIQRALRLSLLKGKRAYISSHGFFDTFSVSQSKLRKKLALRLFGILRNIRSSVLICGSLSEIESAEHYLAVPFDARLLENCADWSDGDHENFSYSSERFEKNYSQEKKIFLMACRFHIKKSILETISAFKILISEGFEASLVILGLPDDHDYEKQVYAQALNCDQIVVTSDVFGLKQQDYLRAANFFVQVSKQEGFSLSTLLAMKFGLTCIISKESNMLSLESSIFIELADVSVSSILDRMRFLMSLSSDELKLRSLSAADFYNTRHSSDVIAKRLLEIYGEY